MRPVRISHCRGIQAATPFILLLDGDNRMMNRNRIGWLLLLALMLFAAPAAAQNPGDYEGLWTNERGSALYITDVSDEGLITGWYVNNAPGFSCQGTPYPLTGWMLFGTNTVTFSVKWENTSANCQSLTTWAGTFTSMMSTITTTWLLVQNNQPTPMQGQDTFTRQATTTHPSLMPPGNPD